MTEQPKDFMSRVMSNLDGEKDAEIAQLRAAVSAAEKKAAHHLFEKIWLRNSAERVIKTWEHVRIGHEPMIDDLVNLRECLASLSAQDEPSPR